MDPLAHQYHGWSPYTYVRNNPLRLIDPNGMNDEDPNVVEEVVEAVNGFFDSIASIFKSNESNSSDDSTPSGGVVSLSNNVDKVKKTVKKNIETAGESAQQVTQDATEFTAEVANLYSGATGALAYGTSMVPGLQWSTPIFAKVSTFSGYVAAGSMALHKTAGGKKYSGNDIALSGTLSFSGSSSAFFKNPLIRNAFDGMSGAAGSMATFLNKILE